MLLKASPRPGPRIFTITPGRPFADDLAAGLLAELAGPVALSRTLVLLPNRRSVRVVTDAFIRQTEGRALLLPRMSPIIDLEPDELPGAFGMSLDADVAGAPVDPMVRQIALARLLMAAGRRPAEAHALAGQLADALDTLTLEGRTAADLAGIDPGVDLQQHWQLSRQLLEIIAKHWPEILRERGLADPVVQRVSLLDNVIRRWEGTGPGFPVVAAGIVNAPLPVARLLGVVARLPQGSVVLPGFDRSIDAPLWRRITGEEGVALETHPQFELAHLLERMRVAPDEVLPWSHRAADSAESSPERARLIARAMTPPAMSGELVEAGRAENADAVAGLRMCEARSPAEEALAIAIALRQIVETPGATGALVTPDRALARRVVVQLRRFAIDIDDSAGQPLSTTPAGSLILALGAVIAERFAPVALLGLCKHPLVHAGEGRLAWLDMVRALDRLVLRGLRPTPGLKGVTQRIIHRLTPAGSREARLSSRDIELLKTVATWWKEEVVPCLAPLGRTEWTAATLLEAVQNVAEVLAGPDLWGGDDGRALAHLLECLVPAANDLAAMEVSAEDAPGLLRSLLECATVRPVWRRHPQLAIWGPLEARLQRPDLLILGGLNEGVWPASSAPDPFLAPAIRRALGLPGLPRRIGLMAHDFVMAAGAPHVLLTRSAREGEAPSIPSRFWQRLQAVAGALPDSADGILPAPSALLHAARSIDQPTVSVHMPRPEPAPPVHERPRRLSVTEVATLRADPFSIYARRMLRLEPLDPLDAEPTGAERGTLVHHILERWFTEPHLHARGIEALVAEELTIFSDRPELAALWQRRVERMVKFVVDMVENDTQYSPFKAEARGTLMLDGILLSGRADRIDRSDRGFRIIDYKTGQPPAVQKVKKLWDTQLALLACMLEEGGFDGIAPGPVVALDYCQLSGGRNIGRMRPALGTRSTADDLARHREDAIISVRQVIGEFLNGSRPFTAKLHPVHGRVSRDYDQLARLAEWLGQ